MTCQDSPAAYLRDDVRSLRRRATDLVAEAWNFLEDGKTSSSKIIPLLLEAAKLIQPADVSGQMLMRLGKPEKPAWAPLPTYRCHSRRCKPVYSLDPNDNRHDYPSITKAQVTGDSYPSIAQSIRRGSLTDNGFRWFYAEKKPLAKVEAVNAGK